MRARAHCSPDAITSSLLLDVILPAAEPLQTVLIKPLPLPCIPAASSRFEAAAECACIMLSSRPRDPGVPLCISGLTLFSPGMLVVCQYAALHGPPVRP